MSKHLTKLAMVGLLALAAACGGSDSSDSSGKSDTGPISYTGMMSATSTDYSTSEDAIEMTPASGNFSVVDGTTYVITITAASDTDGQKVKLKVSHDGTDSDYSEYFATTCTLTKKPSTCTGEVAAKGEANEAARLIIDMGGNAANSIFYFKDAKVTQKGSTTNLIPADAAAMGDASLWSSWANSGAAPKLDVVK